MQANGFDRWIELNINGRHGDSEKQALLTFSKCLDINGDDIAALLGLFRISARTGKTKRIKYYLRKYLNRHPHDIAIMLCLAGILITEDNYGTAYDVLTEILVLDSSNETAIDLMEELENIADQNIATRKKETQLLQTR